MSATNEIRLAEAIQQLGGNVSRQALVEAIRAGQLRSATTQPPFMVTLADVEAYVKAHPETAPRNISVAAFVARFDEDTRTAIVSNVRGVRFWLELLSQGPTVNLASPTVVADLTALEAAGLISAAQVKAALA